jgi:hypothetical protein
MAQSCGNCPTITGDGMHLCAGCTEHLETDLAEVDSTIEDLWATTARMDVGSGSVGKSGHSAPSEPINFHAMETGRTLAVILTGWASALGYPEPHPVKASSVLLTRIREVRAMDWAPVLKQELRDALNDCRRAMDRAADKITLGKCQTVIEGERCPDTVTAIAGAHTGRCRTCGETVDVGVYQQGLMRQAGHVRAPLGRLVRALRSAGHLPGVSLKRVENWVARGKLGPVIPFKAMYTASDIMDAYIAAETYKAEMAAKIAEKQLGRVA